MTRSVVRALLPLALTVFAGSSASASNIVLNPGFELGAVDFTSDYGFAGSGSMACWPEGVYTISASPRDCHPLWEDFGDHTTGTGKMMIVNGSPLVGSTVWQQTVGVTPFTTYGFEAFLAATYPSNPASLNFSINGAIIGNQLQLGGLTGIWTPFSTSWDSGGATTATIALVNSNLVRIGNDFAIDDISFEAYTNFITTETAQAPEPATLLLMSAGLMLIGRQLRRRSTQRPVNPSAAPDSHSGSRGFAAREV